MATAVDELEQIAERIYNQLNSGKVPEMSIPTRSKNNIIFDERSKVWKYGKSKTTRTAKKLDGAYMLLRTTYLLDFIREMSKQQKSSTLRELYYI
ncbi:MAG: DNA topoisomerase VI, partial [Candidatus Poseidoniia archaeon]|nr:DNA topoisomerase VI [Candidatus Poseidoniia archaeon]